MILTTNKKKSLRRMTNDHNLTWGQVKYMQIDLCIFFGYMDDDDDELLKTFLNYVVCHIFQSLSIIFNFCFVFCFLSFLVFNAVDDLFSWSPLTRISSSQCVCLLIWSHYFFFASSFFWLVVMRNGGNFWILLVWVFFLFV